MANHSLGETLVKVGACIVCAVILVKACSPKKPTPAAAAAAAAMARHKDECADMVRARVKYPESLQMKLGSWIGTDFNGPGGTPRVSIDFSARNALGIQIPYNALCVFDSDPPKILIRE